jgi:hypothetical protein
VRRLAVPRQGEMESKRVTLSGDVVTTRHRKSRPSGLGFFSIALSVLLSTLQTSCGLSDSEMRAEMERQEQRSRQEQAAQRQAEAQKEKDRSDQFLALLDEDRRSVPDEILTADWIAA